MDLANPQWAGKLGIAPGETDFQPIITSIADTYGSAAALAWLKASEGKRRIAHLPGQRDADFRGELRPGGDRADQSLLLVPAARGARRRGDAFGVALLRGRGTRVTYLTSPARGSSRRPPTRPPAQKFLAFLVSAAGQRIIAQSDSFEYPLRPGVAANSQLPPLSSLHPDPADTIAKLGDGSTALQLLQQAQLG